MQYRFLVTLALLFGLAGPAGAADLALKRAMLSSAGVGYFEYEAQVDGPASSSGFRCGSIRLTMC